MSSVVVVTPDVVGERMAGPGIRAWHLSRQLSAITPVSLIAKGEAGDSFGVLPHGSSEARRALREAEVIVGQPARGLKRKRRDQKMVYDLFDPTVLELRELYGHAPSFRQRIHIAAEWSRLTAALRTADLLMCAAPQQRLFFQRFQSNDAPWIEVPFGVDLAETKVCAKPKDDIVIWGGGVWEWLDPKTAVDAIRQLNGEGLRVKLLFMGRTRPNQNLVERRREDRFDELLRHGGPDVSANADWVPYRERLAWLRSGRVAIMLHRPTAEAEVAIRTRLFDAIAAGVPVVATERGFAAELVGREGLGIVVPAGDVGAVAAAIRRLITDDAFHSSCVFNLERVRPHFSWEVVTRPLVEAVRAWLK